MNSAASSSAEYQISTNHDNGFCLRIVLEQLQNIDKVGAGNRITTNTYAGTLAKTEICRLFYRFIGQCS